MYRSDGVESLRSGTREKERDEERPPRVVARRVDERVERRELVRRRGGRRRARVALPLARGAPLGLERAAPAIARPREAQAAIVSSAGPL